MRNAVGAHIVVSSNKFRVVSGAIPVSLHIWSIAIPPFGPGPQQG
jgi:hypothetical protein